MRMILGHTCTPNISDQYLLVTKNQKGRAIPNSPGNTLSMSDDYQFVLQTWWEEQKKEVVIIKT